MNNLYLDTLLTKYNAEMCPKITCGGILMFKFNNDNPVFVCNKCSNEFYENDGRLQEIKQNSN